MSGERDDEVVYVTRGQLRELVQRLLIADGMKIEQAKIHAEARVNTYANQLKNIDSVQ